MSRSAKLALLVWTFSSCKVQFVEVRFSEAASFDLQEISIFQLFDPSNDGSLPCAHVVGQCLLPWETMIVLPSVFQEHCVGQLRTHTDLLADQYEVWDLCKTTTVGDDIPAFENDVSVPENLSDVLRVHRCGDYSMGSIASDGINAHRRSMTGGCDY